jgi:hypothetical protein
MDALEYKGDGQDHGTLKLLGIFGQEILSFILREIL